MTHYFGSAIVPAGTLYADAHDLAAKLLAPYDENLCDHEDDCSCEGVWDWWVIGGRWTGALSEYDPEQDPANYERCLICGGTGQRVRSESAFAADWTDQQWNDWVAWSGGCNGCRGKGKALSWRLQPHEGDVAPVRFALNARVPYSVFCEHGFICEDNDWDDPNRDKTLVRAHLTEHHAADWLAIVDYHS